jgi:hypothetical protein
MGFFSRLFGMEQGETPRDPRGSVLPAANASALERYRYMLQTAPPETIEQAHREAFDKLGPEQRRQLLSEFVQAAPVNERSALQATSADDTQALARMATRAEIRQPGTVERALSAGGLGMGGGGGGLFASFAAGFVGSLVAQSFFSALTGGFDAFGASDGAAALDADHGSDADSMTDNDYMDGFDTGDFDN